MRRRIQTPKEYYAALLICCLVLTITSILHSPKISSTKAPFITTIPTRKTFNMSSEEKPTVPDLLNRSKEDIIAYLGGIYEHSSWVAEQFHESLQTQNSTAAPKTVSELFRAMKEIVNNASHESKLELLKNHPDLCEKIERLSNLTEASRVEQSRAGLGSLTSDERAKFTSLNNAYKAKFGFPFILAVRNATKYTVLSSIEGRVGNMVEAEFVAALGQVHKIAWMRLLAGVRIDNPAGFLTCHVLDTANGCPAANMRIHLKRLSPPESAGFIAEYKTNSDGRLPSGPALKGTDFQVGVYEWTFFVGDYFASKNNELTGTPFLDEVPIRFGIDDPEEHYHVPLLVSPWSFSTYRGS
mmetsp:Transcript_37439/g.54803  ORF Transcript_37439/g.54803 Transcript_37439/m.54803 type:complete len:355 (-) Transcript_37439:668-1732(-)